MRVLERRESKWEWSFCPKLPSGSRGSTRGLCHRKCCLHRGWVEAEDWKPGEGSWELVRIVMGIMGPWVG